MAYTKNMRACRLYVETQLGAGSSIDASRDQANYLLNTLRLKDNDTVLLFDGKNGEWEARIEQQSRKKLTLEILTQTRLPPDSENRVLPEIHYLFAPLKRSRLDYLVQKATELGVHVIRPVMTRRTIVSRLKMERIQANIIEAAEQCGILRLPQLEDAINLDQLSTDWLEGGHLVFCDELEAGAFNAGPVEILQGLKEAKKLFVLVGPEGGFDPAERDQLRALPDITILPLGPRILRGDTAAVSALTLVNAVLGDWQANS